MQLIILNWCFKLINAPNASKTCDDFTDLQFQFLKQIHQLLKLTHRNNVATFLKYTSDFFWVLKVTCSLQDVLIYVSNKERNEIDNMELTWTGLKFI